MKVSEDFQFGDFFDWKQFEFSSAETVWIHSRQTKILELSVTNSRSQREETLSHLMSSEQACNPRTQRLRYDDHKFEAQPLLHSEFVASLSYLETPCFKPKTRKKSTPIGYSIPYGQPSRHTYKRDYTNWACYIQECICLQYTHTHTYRYAITTNEYRHEFEENKEEYMEGFGGKKGKEEMYL